MKPNTRKRFVKGIMSAVLASDMTEKELMEIINEFPYDPELSHEIRRGLSALLEVLRVTRTYENEHIEVTYGGPSESENESVETIYEIVKRRKLSKESLLETIGLSIGGKRLKDYSPSYTVRELIARFYSATSKKEQDLFVELLNYGASKDDAFLQGIIRKRQS